MAFAQWPYVEECEGFLALEDLHAGDLACGEPKVEAMSACWQLLIGRLRPLFHTDVSTPY